MPPVNRLPNSIKMFRHDFYFRHISDIFKKVGITVTSENKREVERTIHGVVGVEYKNCSAAWREVKKRIAENKEGFVSKLREVCIR